VQIFGEDYKLFSFLNHLSGQNILLNNFFPDIHNVYPLRVRHEVSHPYKTTGEIIGIGHSQDLIVHLSA
jgi:hypothetical protein